MIFTPLSPMGALPRHTVIPLLAEQGGFSERKNLEKVKKTQSPTDVCSHRRTQLQHILGWLPHQHIGG